MNDKNINALLIIVSIKFFIYSFRTQELPA